MHQYKATVRWQRSSDPFTSNNYSRRHEWEFDGGFSMPASASPQVVPERFTDPSAVDPEEAFVASLSSCHMLWFLSLAAQNGYVVDRYEDHADGFMQENQERKLAITEVILRPVVIFDSNHKPDSKTFNTLHRQAHKRCFIARSVKAEITIKGQMK